MLTQLHSDLQAVDELARSFAARELATHGTERDRDPLGASMGCAVDRAFEAGFLGMLLPPEPGESSEGTGLGALCVVLGRLGRADASLGGIVFASALAQALLARASADQAEARSLLAELGSVSTARQALVAWPIYADPSALDGLPLAVPGAMKGEHLLTGRVELVAPAHLAARALLPARVAGEAGWSVFQVNLPGPGVILSGPVPTLGLQGCPAADLSLEGARARLLGEPGQGARYFGQAAGPMHAAAGAMNAGILRGCLDEALGYARERRQGGRRIVDWSALGMILGDLCVKAEAARMCAEQACLALLAREPGAGRRALAAALHVHELACEGVTDGVQVLGGYGYMKDYGQEKRYRDARQVRVLMGAGPGAKLSLLEEGP